MTEPAHSPLDAELERLVAARTADLTELLAWQANRWDDERRQLARQLHDSLGSSMTALTMHLALLSQHIPADNKSMQGRSAQMKTLLTSIIETNRTMQLELWNDKLEFLGLRAALAELAPAFTAASGGIAAHASLPDDDATYSREQGALLLRCAEEGLRHAAGHAGARRIDVILDDDGEMTMLTVRGDGQATCDDAFTEAASEAQGLRVLRERARFLGGDLTCARLENGGAMLQMTLPREQVA